MISHDFNELFCSVVICVSNNLVITRENTNTNMPMITLSKTFIETRHYTIRYVTAALISPIGKDLIMK